MSKLQVIAFLKLIRFINLLYIQNGFVRIKLNTITKPFSFFVSHCRISLDSPCCVKIFGEEDNHCICNIDIHGPNESDSDEEHIEKQ